MPARARIGTPTASSSASKNRRAGRWANLLFLQMSTVLLIFLAEAFEDVAVGEKVVRDLDGEWSGVHLRVIEGGFDIQVSEVPSAKTFDYPKPFAMRVPRHIEPSFIVEAGGFHHQRVALPVPH